jgi:asparagine synthase (glutamine-hydrolysing)
VSGLFGYFDPEGVIPLATAERMAAVLGCPSDRDAVVILGPTCAVGCISKRIYAGEGQSIRSTDGQRVCLYLGRLLGFSGDDETPDPQSTACRAFASGLAGERLAAANGPFVVALWDDARQELSLATDRYGLYPLYIARYRSAVLFATQLKAILATELVPREWDAVAVALMLSIGEVVDDLTLLRSVRVVPSGTILRFSSAGSSSTKYWTYRFRAESTDFGATAGRLGELLQQAVRRVCVVSPHVGVPLSGGLDSRVLLAATPDPSEVPSFTWGIRGCRDLRYAGTAAHDLKSPHREFEYDGGYLTQLAPVGVWITEGHLPCTDFHVLPYVDSVAEGCDTILNGYAGDVLLGGNFIKRAWWEAETRPRAAAALWRWRDTNVHPSCRNSLFGSALRGCDVDVARTAFVDSYLHTEGDTAMDAAMAFLLDNRIRRRTLCGTELMRWRVESDQPFFDNDFIDFLMRVPHAWRFRHSLYIQMVESCFPTAGRARWDRTGLRANAPRWLRYLSLGAHRLGRYRPFRPLFRSRQVADFPNWMRGPLRFFIEGLLTDQRTLDRGLFRPDLVKRVVADHLAAVADNSSLIGSLMSMEIFARLYVDGDVKMLGSAHATGVLTLVSSKM